MSCGDGCGVMLEGQTLLVEFWCAVEPEGMRQNRERSHLTELRTYSLTCLLTYLPTYLLAY